MGHADYIAKRRSPISLGSAAEYRGVTIRPPSGCAFVGALEVRESGTQGTPTGAADLPQL